MWPLWQTEQGLVHISICEHLQPENRSTSLLWAGNIMSERVEAHARVDEVQLGRQAGILAGLGGRKLLKCRDGCDPVCLIDIVCWCNE